MKREHFDILIIGAGAAGMAAAAAAEKKGYSRILIAERREEPGGVLLQCTHNGFGLGFFGEDLTGVEYARRFRDMLSESCAVVRCGTMAVKIFPDRTALLSGKDGLSEVSFRKCIMACGCRERTIYSLPVAGTRPSGIMTCGTAQKLMNIDGLDIGDDIIILGTGDVGQIMARQLVQSGRKVITMIEKNHIPGGLKRNRENCIKAFRIPVMTDSEITCISGAGRINGVYVKHTDTGKEAFLKCSVLLTAIGMIPERELAEECFKNTPLPEWLLFAGNCDHVHDIVDSVTSDALKLESVL